jgi:hypothetical protein
MSDELECPNCGKLNPPDISNCIGCSLAVSVFETMAKKKAKKPILCSNCNHENPSHLSVCEECGERIERKPIKIEEKREKKEMTKTQEIFLLIGAILFLPVVIVGFVMYFIINAIVGISKGKATLGEMEVEAYGELERGSRKR